jgi:hypothetical protein
MGYMESIRSIYDLSRAPESIKREFLRELIPDPIFEKFKIDRDKFQDTDGRDRLQVIIRREGHVLGVRITNPDFEIDPLYSAFFTDYYDDGIDCIGLNINDPSSPRFQIDLDEFGKLPFEESSARRNIEEEIKALEAGLAPGQVRRGLRLLGKAIECIERFTHLLGRQIIYCEAMAYHNAIAYEQYGFYYQFNTFLQEMIWIDREFRPPNGLLFRKLDDSNPFRKRGFERCIRGRSWAIHDGILGRRWERPTMIKEVGQKAFINTFPDGLY